MVPALDHILELIPATATLGAVAFIPICLSIFLITWGVVFAGTVYVTAAMLLASVYLLCWDADRIWSAASLLFRGRTSKCLLKGAHRLEWVGWTTGGVVGTALLLSTRGFVPASLRDDLFFIGLAAVAVASLHKQSRPCRSGREPGETMTRRFCRRREWPQ